MSKVPETLPFDRLKQHLQSNKIFVPEQFRFRKGTNIENAIFTLTDTILISLNHQQQMAGMFCNLSKVYDYLNHVILLKKNYSITEFEEHVTTGLNSISQTGNKRLIRLHKIQKKVLPIGKSKQWSAPGLRSSFI